MKRLSFILIALLAIVFTVQAQNKTAKKSKTPEEKAERMTQEWTKTLSLTNEQIPKVKSIFLDQAQKKQALNEKYPSEADKAAKKEESKKIKTAMESSLKQVLTPAQYDTYVKTKKEKKAQKKNKGQGSGKGGKKK